MKNRPWGEFTVDAAIVLFIAAGIGMVAPAPYHHSAQAMSSGLPEPLVPEASSADAEKTAPESPADKRRMRLAGGLLVIGLAGGVAKVLTDMSRNWSEPKL